MNRILISEAISMRKCLLHSSSVITRNTNFIINQPNQHQRRNFTQDIWQSISASKGVNFLQDLSIQLHDLSGISWWSTIIVSTVLLRGFVTLPLALYQNKILAKVEKLTLELPDLVTELKRETAIATKKFNWTEQQAKVMYNRSLNKLWKDLIIRDNCHPMKSAVVLIFQLPLWIMQSCALRNMLYMQPDPTLLKAQIVCAEMSLGGIAWFPNLTEIDHSYILPVTLGLINLVILEIQVMSRKIQVNSKLQKYGQYFFRTVSILMIPIAAFVPSGLALYWVSSSSFGLLQNLIVLSPKVRRFARIPKVNSEHEKPYRHLYDKIKERFGK